MKLFIGKNSFVFSENSLKNPSVRLYYGKERSLQDFMPKFFLFLGFWIGRFSDEEDRPHVHAVKFESEETMKIWLEPEVEIAYVRKINEATANRILAEIRSRKDECLDKWYECERKNR